MEPKMINLKINDIPVSVPEGTTVLEAARAAGFKIPSLCYLKDVNEIGSCPVSYTHLTLPTKTCWCGCGGGGGGG